MLTVHRSVKLHMLFSSLKKVHGEDGLLKWTTAQTDK
jgi:hypothetical protein